MRTALPALLVLCLAGCALPDASAPEIRVRNLPPTEADVIEAAIRMHDAPLEGHFWCDGLVDDTKPRTLGRYLAMLISWQAEPDGGDDFVQVRITPRLAPNGKLWQATVMIIGGDGSEAGFGYGVFFLIRQSDGLVLSSSFVCPGTP